MISREEVAARVLRWRGTVHRVRGEIEELYGQLERHGHQVWKTFLTLLQSDGPDALTPFSTAFLRPWDEDRPGRPPATRSLLWTEGQERAFQTLLAGEPLLRRYVELHDQLFDLQRQIAAAQRQLQVLPPAVKEHWRPLEGPGRRRR